MLYNFIQISQIPAAREVWRHPKKRFGCSLEWCCFTWSFSYWLKLQVEVNLHFLKWFKRVKEIFKTKYQCACSEVVYWLECYFLVVYGAGLRQVPTNNLDVKEKVRLWELWLSCLSFVSGCGDCWIKAHPGLQATVALSGAVRECFWVLNDTSSPLFRSPPTLCFHPTTPSISF